MYTLLCGIFRFKLDYPDTAYFLLLQTSVQGNQSLSTSNLAITGNFQQPFSNSDFTYLKNCEISYKEQIFSLILLVYSIWEIVSYEICFIGQILQEVIQNDYIEGKNRIISQFIMETLDPTKLETFQLLVDTQASRSLSLKYNTQSSCSNLIYTKAITRRNLCMICFWRSKVLSARGNHEDFINKKLMT